MKILSDMPVIANALNHNVDNYSLISCPYPKEEYPTVTGETSKID